MNEQHAASSRSARWLALGVLSLAALGATGCNRSGDTPKTPPASTTTPSGSSTSPMPPASAASQ